jgi:hypothetical protein
VFTRSRQSLHLHLRDSERTVYLQSNTLAALEALKTGCASPVNSVCHDALIRVDAGCAVRVCKRLPGRRRHRRLLQRYLQLLTLRIISADPHGTLAATALYAADIADFGAGIDRSYVHQDCCVASDVTAVSPDSLHQWCPQAAANHGNRYDMCYRLHMHPVFCTCSMLAKPGLAMIDVAEMVCLHNFCSVL